MSQIFLKKREDMRWLRDVHFKDAMKYKCAILYGNEDSPTRIELYAVDDYRCIPTVLVPNMIGEKK